jgi:hypothetical protein
MKLQIGVSLWLLGAAAGGSSGCGAPLEADGSESVTGAVFLPAIRSDFNHDMVEDLVFHNDGAGDTFILYGDIRTGVDGDVANSLPSSLNVPDTTGWRGAGVSDFDLDGKPDLLWHNGVTGETQVWFMDNINRLGFTMLTASNPVPDINRTDATGWKVAGSGDFNNDGVPDILWHNGVTGATEIWHMNVLNRPRRFRRIDVVSLPSSLNIPDSTNVRLVGTNDFNRDGKLDLVWHHRVTGGVFVWFMNDATFIRSAAVSQTLPPGLAEVEATDDCNFEGHPDILWHNLQDGHYYRWIMNGRDGLEVQSTVVLVSLHSVLPMVVTISDPREHLLNN